MVKRVKLRFGLFCCRRFSTAADPKNAVNVPALRIYIKMRHIKLFENFTKFNENDFIIMFDKVLSETGIWRSMRGELIKNPPSLLIKKNQNLEVDAQFDSFESTREKIIILVSPIEDDSKEYLATLAHELTHALQFLRDGELDLFITDITREFSTISNEEIWEDLLLGIYLTDPIEEEAWISQCLIESNSTIKYMTGWMNKFNPVVYASQLRKIKPDENQWNLESFDDLPSLWSEVYYEYMDGVNLDKEIIGLGNLTLEEFLSYFNKRFKKFKSIGFR